jgi:sporulation protein YlmC with PRC-barrel domain
VIRLSDMLNLPVLDESGKRLGHVFDVRVRRRSGSSRRKANQRWTVEGLLIGRRGLHDRLGIQGSRRRNPLHEREMVLWSAVLEIGESEIRVRDGTAPDSA